MALGKIKVDQIESSTQVINVDDIGLSSGVSDGNKGDITVSSSGTVWSINDGAVALNELSDVTLTSPSDGQSLSYNASTGQWVNSTPAGGGTVTSVGLVVPAGFSVSGSPVTSSGSITLSFAAGYSLPTTASQANWDTAYSERLYWDGGATGLNAITGRASLGLGNSATLNVGTTAGTVAAGDALGVHVAAADPHPNYALESSLSAVATTGAYSDLSGAPSIPAAADATPQPLGTAAIGVSTDYAREDHVHAMPSAADVGADPAGTASSAISTHVAAADPHPGYALESSLATVATTGAYADLTGKPAVSDVYIIACSNEITALTTGAAKASFRMPYAGTLTAVRATVKTAPTGAALQVDINEAGVSVLSTVLSIDAGETSSTTAATPAVISDSALADDAEITIDIDQIGSTIAGAGLKVLLYVTRS